MTTHETPKWRTLWLLTGFGLLIGIGVATVLLPELRDEPDTGREREVSKAREPDDRQD